MTNYHATVTPTLELSRQVREQMQRLYFRYYDGSDEQTFQHDVESKTDAVLLHSGTKLAGFTMLHQYEQVIRSGPIQVVYSGDTVVDRPHWGQNTLASLCIERMGQYSQLSDLPVYWFLLVKGHRTYRYLSAYCKSFYPHWSIDRSDLRPLADELATKKFGSVYNRDTGVVEFNLSRGHLNDRVAYPNQRHLEKPEVSFFIERNPGYLNGHELVCISELSEQNLKPLTRRLFRRGWRA